MALIITKWLDLGPSLDSVDVRWTRHLLGTPCYRKDVMTILDSDVHSQFEQGTIFPLHDLTRRNRSLLGGRTYLKKNRVVVQRLLDFAGQQMLAIVLSSATNTGLSDL